MANITLLLLSFIRLWLTKGKRSHTDSQSVQSISFLTRQPDFNSKTLSLLFLTNIMASLVEKSGVISQTGDRIGRKLAPFNPTNDDAIEIALT